MKAEWILTINEDNDEFMHHKCSKCGGLAHFYYTYVDGENCPNDIAEWVDPFCGQCGAEMTNVDIARRYRRKWMV